MNRLNRLMTGVASAALVVAATSAFAKDDITVAMQLEPPHLDPTSAAAGAIDSVLYTNVFEGLTRFMGDGSVVPGLAESWEISEDGLTYTFKLREGVTFHDGTTMDAEDVKFTLDRINAEDSANAQKALYAAISEVNVTDPQTVEVKLSEPNGNMLFNLAWGDAVIVAPETVETIKQTPIGTGAFKFENWNQGDKITLTRNDDYWGEAPALASATFKFISDPTAAFASVMAEDVDVFTGFPAPENIPQFEADPRFQVLIGSTEGETILSINNKREPFDNVKVREAVAHAIDRQAIIDGAMFGYGTPIGTHFAPHNPDYVDLTEMSSYDPEKSKALLAEAGYPDGFSCTMLSTAQYGMHQSTAEVCQAYLSMVGINAQLDLPEWSSRVKKGNEGQYDLAVMGTTADNNDPDGLVNVLDGSLPPSFVRSYDMPTPEITELFARGRATFETEERKAIYHELESTAIETVPLVGLAWRAQGYGMKAGVSGFANLPGQLTFYSGITLEETFFG